MLGSSHKVHHDEAREYLSIAGTSYAEAKKALAAQKYEEAYKQLVLA